MAVDVDLLRETAHYEDCPICGEKISYETMPYFGHMLANHDNGVLTTAQKLATITVNPVYISSGSQGKKDGSNLYDEYPDNFCPLCRNDYTTSADLVTHLSSVHDFA